MFEYVLMRCGHAPIRGMVSRDCIMKIQLNRQCNRANLWRFKSLNDVSVESIKDIYAKVTIFEEYAENS
jgi:hypothetical protein